MQKISEIFNIYGDINVNTNSITLLKIAKSTNRSAFVEFSFIDTDIVKTGSINELIKKAE